MRPLDGLVRVVGAAGQEVPFLGYVELDVSFPRTEAGIDNVFQTLVLVVPDNQYNLRVPLILVQRCLSARGRCRFSPKDGCFRSVETSVWCA